jgi:Cu+-exporting ATPase
MSVHDEVCGMTIEENDAAQSVDFQGKTYHFCTDRCRRMFEEHPGWYVQLREVEEKNGEPDQR